jgi:ATP-dependent Clp protease ATP-binding subunit ClpC
MLDLLTEAARKALLQAQEEALRLDHDCTDSAHIVLGLLGGKDDPVAEVLRGSGVDLERGRAWMEVRVGRGSRVRGSVRRPQFTPRAKRAIEIAVREALVTRQKERTGTGLILLRLLREGEAAAMRMLIELGAQPEMIRLRLLRMQEADRPT